MTLAELQDELVDASGAVGPGEGRGKTRLTRMINFGYIELASTVDFKDLFTFETISTVADDKDYTHATDMLSVRSVVDSTNTTNILRISIENYLSLDPATTGKPEKWARAGGLLYLWPVPDAIYSIVIGYNKEPTRLSADTDKTVLPGAYDQAVVLLAAKASALISGDADRAGMFLDAARLYIGSRIDDAAADFSARSQGVTIATSEEDLTELAP